MEYFCLLWSCWNILASGRASTEVIVPRELSGADQYTIDRKWGPREKLCSMQSHRLLFVSIFSHVPRFIEIWFGPQMWKRGGTNLYKLSMFSSNQFGLVNKHCFDTSGLIQRTVFEYFKPVYWKGWVVKSRWSRPFELWTRTLDTESDSKSYLAESLVKITAPSP